MRKYKIFLTIALSLIFLSKGFSQQSPLVIHKVEVLEVIQVSSYTYLRVKEFKNEKWLAGPTVKAKIGEIYFYKGGMEMVNFKSGELNRTFDSVLFLSKFIKNRADLNKKENNLKVLNAGKSKALNPNDKLDLKIETINDGISIAELFKNKKLYEGKPVKIKGKVTKFKSGIMGKNWIHIQDGTAFNEDFELTATTDIAVNVGDTVIVDGKVSVDKDFGAGYFYKIIIEDSKLFNSDNQQIGGTILEKKNTKKSIEKLALNIKPTNDGISIAELLKNKKHYAGKTVIIKGQVTKYSPQVMTKNWIHLQDGTSHKDEFDITLTTTAEVKIGDIIVMEGKVYLDKDFGMGYFYKIIIENAKLIK